MNSKQHAVQSIHLFLSPLQDSLLWARDEILHKLWVSHATAPTNKDFQTVDGQYGQKHVSTCLCANHTCGAGAFCYDTGDCSFCHKTGMNEGMCLEDGWNFQPCKRRQPDDGLNHQKKKHLHDVHFEWQGAAAAPSQSMSKNDVSSEVGWDWICSISKKLCSWYKTSNPQTLHGWTVQAIAKTKTCRRWIRNDHMVLSIEMIKSDPENYTLSNLHMLDFPNILSGKVKPFKQVTERMRRCWFFANAVF